MIHQVVSEIVKQRVAVQLEEAFGREWDSFPLAGLLRGWALPIARQAALRVSRNPISDVIPDLKELTRNLESPPQAPDGFEYLLKPIRQLAEGIATQGLAANGLLEFPWAPFGRYLMSGSPEIMAAYVGMQGAYRLPEQPSEQIRMAFAGYFGSLFRGVFVDRSYRTIAPVPGMGSAVGTNTQMGADSTGTLCATARVFWECAWDLALRVPPGPNSVRGLTPTMCMYVSRSFVPPGAGQLMTSCQFRYRGRPAPASAHLFAMIDSFGCRAEAEALAASMLLQPVSSRFGSAAMTEVAAVSAAVTARKVTEFVLFSSLEGLLAMTDLRLDKYYVAASLANWRLSTIR